MILHASLKLKIKKNVIKIISCANQIFVKVSGMYVENVLLMMIVYIQEIHVKMDNVYKN